MSNLARRIEDAGRQVGTDWSEERAHAVERAMLRRRARHSTTRLVLAAAATILLVVGVGAGWTRFRPQASLVPAATYLTGLSGAAVRLEDGSRASPLQRSTSLRPTLLSPTRVVLALDRGPASFDVTPDPSREFVVNAGAVEVKVLGTQFTVDKREADVVVVVQRGRVRVTWPDGVRELAAGEQGAFPPPLSAEQLPPDSGAPPARDDKPAVPAPSSGKPPASADGSQSEWRALAGQGEFSAAYDAMKREGRSSVRDDAADLLLAADVARMSRHSSEAVEPLRRLLSAHRSDPRASLAAFTLGRVLLDELGRPGEAAAAFADTRALAPGGALAQDALARQVEALSKAGDSAGAHQLALEYLRLYPEGRRAKSVRKFGGVE